MFNRFKRGRTLDEVHAYGGDLWGSELALAGCAQDGCDERCNHLDTTSVSRTGDDGPDRAEHAMAITPGSATDHRPDLQQAVFARMVSQDGGGPLMRQSGDGHASDTQMVQERAQALLATLRASPQPRDWVADAKRYTEDQAPHLAKLGLITRIPGRLTLVTQGITPALPWDTWPSLHARTRDQCLELCPYRMAQRWLVGVSPAALERAEASVTQAGQRAAAALTPHLWHLQAQRFETPTQAHEAWSGLARKWRDHQVESSELRDPKRDGTKGRPTAATPSHAIAWQMPAQGRLEAQRREDAKPQTACCVLGTNLETEQRSDAAVLAGDNAPSQAEGGCRWLKDPVLLVASWVGQKPRRMQGLWLVRTLALLGDAVAPRHLRRECARPNDTLPHHINPPTSRPTRRWVWHVWDGIARVRVTGDGQVRDRITGVKEVTITLLHLVGAQVCHVYQWPSGEDATIATAARAIPDNVQLPCAMSAMLQD
jgi:transposase